MAKVTKLSNKLKKAGPSAALGLLIASGSFVAFGAMRNRSHPVNDIITVGIIGALIGVGLERCS